MRALKIVGVIVGAVVLTSLGIDAADTLSGSTDTMLARVIGTDDHSCPEGMVAAGSITGFDCVDSYELSAGPSCPVQSPSSLGDTRKNIAIKECQALSKENAEPWRYITREDAQLMCLRGGKRLPTNEEWFMLAAGTPDREQTCNTSSSDVRRTGDDKDCVSSVGVYDAIGNVWEWTADDAVDGSYNGRTLPQEGYVRQVDSAGLATQTGDQESDIYYGDYFWSQNDGVFAIIRGGFYGSKSDAGVYSTHAATLPSSASVAIGFRCVLSL